MHNIYGPDPLSLRTPAGTWCPAHAYALGRVVVALAVIAPLPAAAQSVDSIIARVAAARGGLGVLHTVRSKRLTGHMTLDSITSGTIVVEQRRPNMIREEITFNGQTLVRAFDGVSAWTMVPAGAGTDSGVHVLTGDDARNLAAEGDFDGAIIDARVKGNDVALAGRDSIAGTPVYKLKVTLRSGYVDYWYIDSATALPSKWEGMRIINGKPIIFESFFRDYLTVDGQRFVRVVDSGSPGSAAHQEMVFDHIDINPTLDNTRFAAPVADSAATGATH